MRTVWRFPLRLEDRQVLIIPRRAEVLSVGTTAAFGAEGEPCLWAIIDTGDAQQGDAGRSIVLVTDGGPLPEGVTREHYIGTFPMFGGKATFHAFEAP